MDHSGSIRPGDDSVFGRLFHLPDSGGMAVERFGSRTVLAISLVLWSIFTALTGAMSALVMLAGVRFFLASVRRQFFLAAIIFLPTGSPGKSVVEPTR